MSDYPLGYSEEESRRLDNQHALWYETTHALWRRAGLDRGHAVLDLGCGTGLASLDLADAVGSEGRIVSIDNDEAKLKELRARIGERKIYVPEARDVQTIDGISGPFDFVYARWIFMYLRREDISEVLRKAAVLLKPGGRFIAQEYVNYSSATTVPDHPAVQNIIMAFEQLLRKHQHDPDAGAHLPQAARDAGLIVEDVRVIVHRAGPGMNMWAWPDEFYRLHVPLNVGKNEPGFSSEAAEEFLTSWNQLCANPGAIFFTWPVLEIIARKP